MPVACGEDRSPRNGDLPPALGGRGGEKAGFGTRIAAMDEGDAAGATIG
jgi:hypothetical protein